MAKKWYLNVGAIALTLLAMGCSNNPFYPKAEAVITNISSADDKKGAGIEQKYSAKTKDLIRADYTYYNPKIKLENRKGLPRIIFDKAYVIYNIDGIETPLKTVKLTITVMGGSTFEGTLPILDSDSDLRNIVYPGDSPAKVTEGSAEIVLSGKDDNGYNIETGFYTPLKFYTDLSGVTDISIIPGLGKESGSK